MRGLGGAVGPQVYLSNAEGDRLSRHLRLIEIDRLIRARGFPNATGLAKHCGVTRKTIQRDLDTLRWEMGAPIEYDGKQRGYHYSEPGFALPAVMVSERELLALLVAQKAIENYSGTPLEAPLRAAFEKVLALVPPEGRASLAVVPESIRFAGIPGPAIDPEIWDVLHRAIRERQTLDMRRPQIDLQSWSAIQLHSACNPSATSLQSRRAATGGWTLETGGERLEAEDRGLKERGTGYSVLRTRTATAFPFAPRATAFRSLRAAPLLFAVPGNTVHRDRLSAG